MNQQRQTEPLTDIKAWFSVVCEVKHTSLPSCSAAGILCRSSGGCLLKPAEADSAAGVVCSDELAHGESAVDGIRNDTRSLHSKHTTDRKLKLHHLTCCTLM